MSGAGAVYYCIILQSQLTHFIISKLERNAHLLEDMVNNKIYQCTARKGHIFTLHAVQHL